MNRLAVVCFCMMLMAYAAAMIGLFCAIYGKRILGMVGGAEAVCLAIAMCLLVPENAPELRFPALMALGTCCAILFFTIARAVWLSAKKRELSLATPPAAIRQPLAPERRVLHGGQPALKRAAKHRKKPRGRLHFLCGSRLRFPVPLTRLLTRLKASQG